MSEEIFAGCDEEQIRLMAEECILIDRDDAVTGHDSKKNCHLMENIETGLLHRAFSVFLFTPSGELVLQKRASEKITFPDHWTNTCCSHPLYREEELEAKGQLGVRRAARRKLEHELGIDPKNIDLDEFVFITRIHYLAASDPVWGEHEIDYVLFLQKDLELQPNPNEVSDVKYVTQSDLTAMVQEAEEGKLLLTPWFKLINDKFLYAHWDALLNKSLNPSDEENESILRLGFDDDKEQ